MNKHDSQQTELQSESYQPFQLDLTGDAGQAPQRQCADVGRASAVSDAESHWREVNKLTKALRKRGRGSRRRSDQATSQKSLWLPSEANGQDHNRREVGLQVCRHLVAALRLQHQQELSDREASNASAVQRSA